VSVVLGKAFVFSSFKNNKFIFNPKQSDSGNFNVKIKLSDLNPKQPLSKTYDLKI